MSSSTPASIRCGLSAREKLAKVAGIVSGHPGLKLDVEGHTDSVGGDDYNQQLSEQRGDAVREYLTNRDGADVGNGEGLRQDPAGGIQRHRARAGSRIGAWK